MDKDTTKLILDIHAAMVREGWGKGKLVDNEWIPDNAELFDVYQKFVDRIQIELGW